MFPPTDIRSGWGSHGTVGGPMASFFKRYHSPLVRYARYKFSISDQDAEELASAFLLRELEKERRSRSLYQLYKADKGRFRNLLASSFWRFCRDQLKSNKDRRALSLDRPELIADDEAGLELGRLITRELFNTVRMELAEGLDEDERRVLSLKWPEDPDRAPASNAELQRQLGLTRGRVRQVMGRLADRFTLAFRRMVREAGLNADEARALLGSCSRILQEEQRPEDR